MARKTEVIRPSGHKLSLELEELLKNNGLEYQAMMVKNPWNGRGFSVYWKLKHKISGKVRMLPDTNHVKTFVDGVEVGANPHPF